MCGDVVNRDERCLKCGSSWLVKRGRGISNMKSYWVQRYQCGEKNCGHKQTGKKRHYQFPDEFQYQSKEIPTQDWSAYTSAQNFHKQYLMQIMTELSTKIEIKQSGTVGRPAANIKEIFFALGLKTFTKLSSRRLHTDLVLAKELGFIEHIPHFTTLMDYLGKEELTELLEELIRLSSLPIKPIDTAFASDSSGFSTSQFGHWMDVRNGRKELRREYLKAHITVGTITNIVTSVEVTLATGADSPQFEKLITETGKHFDVKEVSADKAYSSKKNLEIVTNLGATPYIPFKSNITGKKGGSQVWWDSFQFFQNHPQEFFEHYHKRSNVETTFFMIKQKFGPNLVTKTFTGQKNEILLKIFCHNVVCLIHEYYENKIQEILPTEAQKPGFSSPKT